MEAERHAQLAPLDTPAGEAPPSRARPGSAALFAAVLVLGVVAYANALGGAFVFDDVIHIRDNPLVRDLSRVASLDGLRAYPHRWLAYLTFALNYRTGGLAPAGYHAFNVAVHLANAALVYALVLLAFRTPRLVTSTLAPRARAVAFVAAALFVAHPLQTQAVTYVVQRMTSLAALFYLSSVLSFLRWRLAEPGGARARWYAATIALALLGMKTKEIAFTLPFAILLAELALFRTTRADLLRLVPVLATAVVVPATHLWTGAPLSGTLSALGALAPGQAPPGRLEYLATQLAVVVTYLFLILVPVGQNVDHDYPIHRSFLAPEVLSGAAVLLALAALGAWLAWRTRARATRPLDPAARLAAFGIGWWFLALAVESSIIPIVDVIVEHRVYLPSVGLFTAAALGIAALAAHRWEPAVAARRTIVVGAALAMGLAAAAFARNRAWASDVSIWTDSALKSPGKTRPWLNLGTALREAGRPEAAVAALRRALELDPASSYGRSQLGAVLASMGRRAEAEPELRAALTAAPEDVEALFNYAVILWETGRRDEARTLFARFAALAPDSLQQAKRIARARAAPPADSAGPRDPPAGLR